MRILHVIPSYLPAIRYGGPIFSVQGMSTALIRRGHHVEVFTTDTDGSSRSDVPIATPVNIDGVSVWYFQSHSLKRIYYAPAMREILRARLHEFDVVHIHSLFLWPTAMAARESRRRRVPYVVSPRGMLVRSNFRRRSTLAKYAWLALIDGPMLRGASAIHATTMREMDESSRFGMKLPPVRVIPNGVDAPGRLAFAGPQDDPYLLFLGRINWVKGLDRLIPALVYIPKIRLVVAGADDGFRATLESTIKQLGLESRVEFIGIVDGEAKTRLLSAATLLVLPSYSENFGNVVLEAMACECPVAVTEGVGAHDIVIQSGAGIHLPSDCREMGRAISNALEAPHLLREMGRAGRAVVLKRFGWDAVATEYEQLYASIAARS